MSHLSDLEDHINSLPLTLAARIPHLPDLLRTAQAEDDKETLGLIEAEWYANEGKEA